MSVEKRTAESHPPSLLRTILFPIRSWELHKFIPMALMKGFIVFNWALLRGTKDTLVITAQGSGAEVISFIKTWGVVPIAILFLFLYTRLSNRFSREALFYGVVGSFLLYFASFALYFYPHVDSLHMSLDSINALKEAYPNFQWFFPILGNWTYSLFYVLAELWGSVVLSLLFWQFANEINTVPEAKRFYAMFGVSSSFFMFLGGLFLIKINQYTLTVATGVDAWKLSITYTMMGVVFGGLMILGFYVWTQRRVIPRLLQEKKFAPQHQNLKKEHKTRLSLRESFGYIFTSRYLGCIAIMVFAYGISINLIEMTWKDQMKRLYPNPGEFSSAMGDVLIWVGLVSMTLMWVGVNIMRVFSWLTAALVTPIAFAVTGGIFFIFVLFEKSIAPLISEFLGVAPIVFAVWMGKMQNVLSKGVKYSLFDPTKEMSYIPLDDELKVKGKAAVDVVGERMGKAGGAVIQQILLIITAGSQTDIAPYLALIVAVILVFWLFAVFGLSKRFNAAIQGKNYDVESYIAQKTGMDSGKV